MRTPRIDPLRAKRLNGSRILPVAIGTGASKVAYLKSKRGKGTSSVNTSPPHSRFVPSVGTIVGFTASERPTILPVSSSGGGLFGRPATRKSSGRSYFLQKIIARPRC
jgi:hypothetical protein